MLPQLLEHFQVHCGLVEVELQPLSGFYVPLSGKLSLIQIIQTWCSLPFIGSLFFLAHSHALLFSIPWAATTVESTLSLINTLNK